MFESLPRPASPERLTPQPSSLPAWMAPATALAMQTAIEHCLAHGGDTEAACRAAALVAMARHPALSMALITHAAQDLIPPS